jgi:hypothetical protein
MAYLNEFGETIGCTISTADQVKNFFSGWYFTLLPLVLLVVGFFVLKKYVKNKIILIAYVVLVILLYIWWIPKTLMICT